MHDPTAPLILQSLVMLVTFVVLGMFNALGYGYMTSHLQVRMITPWTLQWLTGVPGSVLIAIEVPTATLERLK